MNWQKRTVEARDMMRADEYDSRDPGGQPQSPAPGNEVIVKRAGNRHSVLTVAFSAVVFAASAWYIGRTFEWGNLGRLLREVNLACLIVGGGATLMAFWMLRTLRWHILLRRTNTHVPLVDLYLCTAVSLSFALFTPLQSGEMLKVELLKKYGMLQRFPGYGSFLVEKALDLATLLGMACVSLLAIFNLLPNVAYVYGTLGCLTLGAAAGLLVLTKLRLKGRWERLVEPMRQCVGDLPTLALVAAITFVSWAAVALSWQVTLYSGGLHLGFAKSMALMSLVGLASILSFIPGGIGISEAGTSQMLIHFGFAVATAQAGALVLRSGSLVVIALGAGHLGLWKVIRSRRSRRLALAAAAAEALTHGASASIT